MACPYFVPTEKWDGGGWLHPSRLPLGGGWQGRCSAPGHEQAQPEESEVRELCNLGYAKNCSRLPDNRQFDAVRFCVTTDRDQHLSIAFTGESAHLPIEYKQLEFDTSQMQWTMPHPDARIQRQADCYIQSYLQRRTKTS
jgi:hypothetical protein